MEDLGVTPGGVLRGVPAHKTVDRTLTPPRRGLPESGTKATLLCKTSSRSHSSMRVQPRGRPAAPSQEVPHHQFGL
ncbi:hypothetical protein E2C01_007950 [Portunus trituberculatus]|uniref:Uncharacterized protein n=1 Tax=Portunus trituberculatus TaxID=210409 RepID=A0A5B7D3P3_PORTR|nr:hypothetical protein [Portunus trituberculatus]